jgi:hypothetical protein
MAKKKKNKGNVTSTNVTNTFIKGMNKDLNASFVPKESWFHAINAYNNSADGDAGTLGNEPANLKCSDIPYPVIGAIHKEGDMWYIYSTDDISSEIGMLDDSKCEYTTIVNDPCLNFNRKYLITGASKENYDCTWQVYWDDNLNPSRTLNVDDIPYVQIQLTGPDINGEPCVTFQDTDQLDCEKIRLAPLVQTPCLELTRDIDGGLIRNGSYQAYIAYVVNEQVVTDYIGISNIQSLFVHDDVGSSLNLKLSDLDQSFEFYELVILSNAKEQVVAKRIGIYSTEQNSVSVDFIDPALVSIPLEQLFGRRPAYEKSESMYVVNDYLIRQGPTEQFDFNYQPLANQIQTKWQVAQYPADYYYKGGYKTSFMRDEQYAFFIRWIYNTGERSASYHIPGRAPRTNGYVANGIPVSGSELDVNNSTNSLNTDEQNWQVFNTASVDPPLNIPIGDGGFIIAEGDMAYWQSTERYPATKPEIYNASSNPIWDSISPEHDLCGEYIRHHKMPTEEVNNALKLSTTDGQFIRILGVKFLNIKRPLFNDGTVIPNIVGYEILRGSREGAKSIMAKGIFKNMREYTLQDDEDSINTSQLQGLYPNYPYNDLRDDVFFHTGGGITGKRTEDLQVYTKSIVDAPPLSGVSRDVFTFHTPELPFRKPYLNAYETRFYGKYKGESIGYFRKSEEHPGQKLLLNYPIIYAALLGMGYAFTQFKGKKNNNNLPVKFVHHNHDYAENTYTGQAIYLSGTQLILNPGSGRRLSQPGSIPSPGAAAFVGVDTAQTSSDILFNQILQGFTDFTQIVDGGITTEIQSELKNTENATTISLTGGTEGSGTEIQYEGTNFKSLPTIIRAAMSIPGFMVYTSEGANVLIDLFYNLMSYQDYALKHNSHGYYTDLARLDGLQFRSENIASNYIGSSFNIFGEASNQLYKINNLFRTDTIAINTDKSFPDDPRDNEDLSRYNLGQLEFEGLDDIFRGKNSYRNRKFKRPICSLYGALKFKIDNQYGQLEGIKQTPMRGCVQTIDQNEPLYFPFESEAFFTGDVYINRYTEKTTMPIFTDFLYGQPDGFVYDYLKYTNIPYPRYWMNTERYDFTKIFNIFTQFASVIQGDPDDYFSILPSDLYAVDVPAFEQPISSALSFAFGGLGGLTAGQSLFSVTNGYVYTHINGVQDFFVESELNMAQRDWKEAPERRHYDPYLFTDINTLFDAKIQKEDNFYLYDYSLSASRFITNLTSFGVIQPRDYDPQIAETCFTFYPKRLIYSLRAQEEAKKDFWRVFLPNNYKDFKNKVSVIKPVNQTGALMFFPYASPKMFMGVDQLQTDLGTKVILGDGGLFAREPQNITNSDLANEYASCESARSVINTPMGVFFISQAQGKIFQYTGKLQAISDQGMKWWFNKYLPSILLRQYPELEGTELEDNPVVGIGCQAVYDINDDIVYFMKKDYSVKDDFKDNVIFDINECQFRFTNDVSSFPIKLGDPFYFDNASWTVSYDPKIKGWISFHDWHPELSLPSVNHFLTTKTFTSNKPQCPPGYVLNNDTGVCEKLITESAPGFVDIDERDADIIYSEGCPLDIVITVDTSSSTDGPPIYTPKRPMSLVLQSGGPTNIEESERMFVWNFINNPDIVQGMNNGVIQIGFGLYSLSVQLSFTFPNGNTMTNNTTNLSTIIDNWLIQNWQSGGTNAIAGMQAAENILNDKANSDLPTNFQTNGFRQILINVNDAVDPLPFCGVGPSTVVNFQSSLLTPDGSYYNPINSLTGLPCSSQAQITPQGPANQFAYSIITTASGSIAASSAAYAVNCWQSAYTFSITPNQSTVSTVVNQVVDSACAEPSCSCPDGYTLVYPDVNSTPVIWNQNTGDCTTIVSTTTGSGTGGGTGNTNAEQCNCYNYIFLSSVLLPTTVTEINVVQCDGTVINYQRNSSTGLFPDDLGCVREEQITINGPGGINIFDFYKPIGEPCGTYTCCGCSEFTITDPNASGNQGIPGFTVTFERCNDGQQITRQFIGSEALFIECARNNSLQFPPNINFNQLNIVENPCGTYPCDDTTGGGGTIVTTETYDAICRKIDCGCPPSPIPNATVTQTGDCDNLNVYTTTGVNVIPPGLIQCDYQALLQVPPSFERGSIWRHNYRCDLFANYYDVDYPWEVELVENTGQMVTTVRSLEYQLETYVYKGDLINGCGDDRWHDLDFNFDKSIIYNSEQVSGLLTLIPHPKEDPLSMITYPIIGGSDIQILYSKEEQKYRFNQFWDITADRGEFSNAEQNIFITQLNGYIKDLNLNNLAYSKTSDQRKKFRHYYNKVILRRTLSGNRKMLLKLNNTKLNLSIR